MSKIVPDGSIVLGGGKTAYAIGSGLHSTMGDETSPASYSEEIAMLMLGGSKPGGIVGRSKKGIVENCVNTGARSAHTGTAISGLSPTSWMDLPTARR